MDFKAIADAVKAVGFTGFLSLIGGVILILMGMLILTGRLDQLANVLFPFSP